MDGYNWYVYCNSNPILYIDRNGLWPIPGTENNGGNGDQEEEDDTLTQLGQGLVGGLIGYFQNIGNTIRHPIKTMKASMIQMAIETVRDPSPANVLFNCYLMTDVTGTASMLKRDIDFATSLISGDAYGVGYNLGNRGGEAALMAATVGAGKVFGAIGKAFRGSAKSMVAPKPSGWRVGDPIDNLTRAGNNPAWSTVRQRFWKNEAFYNPEGYPGNLGRMRQGLAPQQYNEITMKMESMELHHLGGRNIPNAHNIKNLRAVWPDQHAAIDIHRHTGR